jgi:hypothetical protein
MEKIVTSARKELLLGCGAVRDRVLAVDDYQDWSDLTTLDINPDHHPDVVYDIGNIPLPFDDESFDEIHAYEVLEHVGRQGDFRFFFAQFSDFWRILRPNGAICGSCPHLRSAWFWGDPGHTRVIQQESLLFLNQEEYTKQVGVTPMSDYRHWYKADFQPLFSDTQNGRYFFAMRAIKPSRISI